MSKWVIVKLTVGQVLMLTKAGTSFTDNVKEAMHFDSETDAILFSATIKTPTLVHQLADDSEPEPEFYFPKPDFFESSPDLMDLKTLVEMIRAPDLLEFFVPVDKITGACQMTGGGISDPITGRISGRYYQFSFDQCLSDSDVARLNDIVRITGGWDYMEYKRIRLGFTEYAVLTLKVKMP